MYAPQNRTYYTLQDDNDFPIGPPLLLPQCNLQGSEDHPLSELNDLCSLRAHSRFVSRPPGCSSPPLPGRGVSSSTVSSPTESEVLLGEQVVKETDDSPRVPPGLGSDDLLTSACGDLATYCTALDLCESSSWPLDEDFALMGSSGSLLQSSSDAQGFHDPLFSLSSLHFLGTLGRGGYGKVLLADSSSSTRVAVKVMGKKDMTRDDVAEVKTEVRILRMLTGMNDSCLGAAFTQTMHSTFQTKEHVFMIMHWHSAPLSHPAVRRQLRLRPELGYLQQLQQTLPNSISLPIAFPSSSSLYTPYDKALKTLRLCSAELLLGLLFLHSQGIVHQDIKPANLLVSAQGHIVITDFGSARFLPVSRYHYKDEDSPDFSCNAARRRTEKTQATFGPIVLCSNEQVSYTERYAAPELLQTPPGMEGRNILVYDERVDFYSLGVTLREMASDNIASGTIDRWDCASDGAGCRTAFEVDAEFTNFCEGLLAQDPDERLHGLQATGHPFFDPITELWDDIATLRYPPFAEVVWPEVEADTRLDLRAYSGDDGDDSFECDDNVDLWIEAIQEIPFDVDRPLSDVKSPLASERQVASPVVSVLDAGATLEEPVEELCPSSNDWSIALPSLSLLPTIPSLESSSPRSVKDSCEKREPSNRASCHSDSVAASGRESPSLRRRPAVHDLRRAFQLSSDLSYAQSSHPNRSAARVALPRRRNANVGARRSIAKHAGPAMSFEHEITIALLATMGGKSAPMSTLCSPSAPTRAGVHRSGRRGSGKARSILRKFDSTLKGLVPW